MCHSMHSFATRVVTSQLMIRETGCFGLIAASRVTFFTAALWDSVLQQPALKHNFPESYENLKNASPICHYKLLRLASDISALSLDKGQVVTR